MKVAGCDIGSLTAKAVIMDDGEIVSTSVLRVTTRPRESAENVMGEALGKIDLKMDDIDLVVGTGYGKDNVPFIQQMESEISCHGKGAWWADPSVRTVIDIGGQDAKAIKLDEKGDVVRYFYNDKCASGTGRFIEIIAEALGLDLAEISTVGEDSKEDLRLSNQCVVFAETEVISLLNDGKYLPDIVNGLNNALAGRVAAMAKSIKVESNVIMTGGVAKNKGVRQALETILGCALVPHKEDPQLNGAIGAAIIGMESVRP
ncbi:MAG: 2-hydroxyglutaryl-CoA dehydratase [Desulfobacterales bacterium]|nr:2-hydroxyglutaryl-CoA dehydratase [Desulfobacterales bacterium]